MRPVATSEAKAVTATKLAVPRGAEDTVKVSPMSIVHPTVMVVSCFTGTTEATELTLNTELSTAVPLSPIEVAVFSTKEGDVVKIASAPEPERTRVP